MTEIKSLTSGELISSNWTYTFITMQVKIYRQNINT